MSKGNSGLFVGTKGDKQTNQASKPLLNKNLSEEQNQLIQKVIDKGFKISPEKVLEIGKRPNGQIVWVEKGKLIGKPSGLEHIWDRHSTEFTLLGITKNEVPKFVIDVIKNDKKVGLQGNNEDPREVFEYNYKGKVVYLAVSISTNGYVVGANFTTKIKKENEK